MAGFDRSTRGNEYDTKPDYSGADRLSRPSGSKIGGERRNTTEHGSFDYERGNQSSGSLEQRQGSFDFARGDSTMGLGGYGRGGQIDSSMSYQDYPMPSSEGTASAGYGGGNPTMDSDRYGGGPTMDSDYSIPRSERTIPVGYGYGGGNPTMRSGGYGEGGKIDSSISYDDSPMLGSEEATSVGYGYLGGQTMGTDLYKGQQLAENREGSPNYDKPSKEDSLKDDTTTTKARRRRAKKKGHPKEETRENTDGSSFKDHKPRTDFVRDRAEAKERLDIENAYYDRANYTPRKHLTDARNVIEGTKSLPIHRFHAFAKSHFMSEKLYEWSLYVAKQRDRVLSMSIVNNTKHGWEREIHRLFNPGNNKDIKYRFNAISAPNPDFNCHSYLFTDGRAGWLPPEKVQTILKDNQYTRIATKHFPKTGSEDSDDRPIREDNQPIRYEKGKELPKKGDAVLYYERQPVYRDGVAQMENVLVHSGFISRINKDGDIFIKSKLGGGGKAEHHIDAIHYLPSFDHWEIQHTERENGRHIIPVEE